MQKRIHNKGYYIQWNKNYKSEKSTKFFKEKEQHIPVNDEIALAEDTELQENFENEAIVYFVEENKSKITDNHIFFEKQVIKTERKQENSIVKKVETIIDEPSSVENEAKPTKKWGNRPFDKIGLTGLILALLFLASGILTMVLFLPSFVGLGLFFLLLTAVLFVVALLLLIISRVKVIRKPAYYSKWFGISGILILIGALFIIFAFPFLQIVLITLAILAIITALIFLIGFIFIVAMFK